MGVHHKNGWTPSMKSPQVFWSFGHWMRTGWENRYDASRVNHPAPSAHQRLLMTIKRER
jgi:hypothetical protein